jgi:hypothetical protein
MARQHIHVARHKTRKNRRNVRKTNKQSAKKRHNVRKTNKQSAKNRHNVRKTNKQSAKNRHNVRKTIKQSGGLGKPSFMSRLIRPLVLLPTAALSAVVAMLEDILEKKRARDLAKYSNPEPKQKSRLTRALATVTNNELDELQEKMKELRNSFISDRTKMPDINKSINIPSDIDECNKVIGEEKCKNILNLGDPDNYNLNNKYNNENLMKFINEQGKLINRAAGLYKSAMDHLNLGKDDYNLICIDKGKRNGKPLKFYYIYEIDKNNKPHIPPQTTGPMSTAVNIEEQTTGSMSTAANIEEQTGPGSGNMHNNNMHNNMP